MTTPSQAQRGGKVVVVGSPKGGVGRTAVAVNLALALNSRNQGRVIIVDTDLQFGDVALALQAEPDRSIAEATAAIRKLDARTLPPYLSRHESGLWVLAAPPDPVTAEDVGFEELMELVALLKRVFRWVVIDTPVFLGEPTLSLFEISDRIFIVVDPDLQTVKDSGLMLDTLRRARIDLGQFRIVLNRADVKGKMDTTRISQTLGLPVVATIPRDDRMLEAVNRGVPLFGLQPKSKATAGFRAMAELLDSGGARPSKSRNRRGS